MLNRGGMTSNKDVNFAKWLKDREDPAGGAEADAFSFYTQVTSIQLGVSRQMSELSGALPDANALTGAEFRDRVSKAVYLLLASVGCGLLAFFVGLPTIVLRPAKFVVFMTLATLLAIGSVMVLQTPGAFMRDLMEGGVEKSLPFGAMVATQLATLYVAVFVHRYIYIVIFGGCTVLSILYYLSSFIPGGTKGLQILLRSGYDLISAALMPCRIFVKRQIALAFSDN